MYRPPAVLPAAGVDYKTQAKNMAQSQIQPRTIPKPSDTVTISLRLIVMRGTVALMLDNFALKPNGFNSNAPQRHLPHGADWVGCPIL
jgi:hypothetical protein